MSHARSAQRMRLALELPGTTDSVKLVRSTIRRTISEAGFERHSVDGVITAVSEACNNVVLHAYPGGMGPLIVDLTVCSGHLDVIVRDRGIGMRRESAAGAGLGLRRGCANGRGLGMGLVLISAMSDRAEFSSAPGNGTEVRMTFNSSSAARRRLDQLNLGVWPLASPEPSIDPRVRSG